MKNTDKKQLAQDVINYLTNEGLDNKEKRRILQSACNKMTKLIKAGNLGNPEEKGESEESDDCCPKESIMFEN